MQEHLEKFPRKILEDFLLNKYMEILVKLFDEFSEKLEFPLKLV